MAQHHVPLIVAMLASGCAAVENQDAPGAMAALSEPSFRCNVEPILARDCSFTACHGMAGAPFRVYSVGKLRAGAMRTLDDRTAPLTEDERHANFLGALGFTFGGVKPDDNLLLRKPMPAKDGGYGHRGGAVYTGPDDPRAVAIRAWLAGGTACAGGAP